MYIFLFLTFIVHVHSLLSCVSVFPFINFHSSLVETEKIMMAGSVITPPQTSKGLAASLLEDCNALLSELAFLQSHLAAIGKPNAVELRQFKSFVQSELKSLKKLSELAAKTDTPIDGPLADGDGDNDGEKASQDEAEIRVLHSLRSSNLPFYSSVWNVSKSSCCGLVAFSKRFYWYKAKRNAHGSGRDGMDGIATPTSTRDLERSIQGLHVSADAHKAVEENLSKVGLQKRSVLVDIVADNGEEWVKVSTVTTSRLLFELAKRGWEMGCDSTSEDGEAQGAEVYRLQNDDDSDDDDEDTIELVRLATDMKKAAALVRVRYKHPRIRFVLPKIVEGETPEVDAIIKDIRKTGVTVECSTDTEDAAKLLAAPNGKDNGHHQTKTVEELLLTLLPNPHPHMTSTLNVDCTLLLALVSDLSHFQNIDPSAGHHPAITRQIELEAKQPLVTSELWPAMGDRQLVCTEEAAKRMYEIVETIGTAIEKKRTKIMMAGDINCDREDLISQFQELSDHKVPLNWNIPIRVVNAHAEIERGWADGVLPPVARIVASQLSDINTSVFLYGWATGLMTISSNRTVAKQIEVLVEENRNGDDELSGPLVWICDTARSLIGKDSNRKA
ncbi:hypothetical protein BDBG_08222 [Blastomyces gilchristii SLH14081]|uniref:DUF1308 domain-containing protein n=1 Tax=Blastomyces gilchristii (strain SLH14081) TaxID=559298 RepID=A0A179UYP7_BLAGS|nr:uncharacterized protein BDBG_08222 [Blastomyces gilchristii SLH14081]OAT12943.1 hypothetical protein BDBG_08222 [Blastomyces gilchristii SLH14081]